MRTEIPKIKGSRFIADLAPVVTESAAAAFLASIRAAHPDARHHCFAWRLGRDGGDFRAGDDGEPSGTAGRPILRQLEGADVTDVVLVVTRYFGGTKLGAGGLVRAYAAAAAAALGAADVREVTITRRVTVRHGYDDTAALEAFMSAHRLTPIASAYEDAVRLAFDIPEDEVADVVNELRDRTSGRAEIEVEAHDV